MSKQIVIRINKPSLKKMKSQLHTLLGKSPVRVVLVDSQEHEESFISRKNADLASCPGYHDDGVCPAGAVGKSASDMACFDARCPVKPVVVEAGVRPYPE